MNSYKSLYKQENVREEECYSFVVLRYFLTQNGDNISSKNTFFGYRDSSFM